MPRVLIIGSGTLLDEGMTGLLQAETDFQVTSVTYRTEEDLIQRIVQLQPEAIVISETNDLRGCQIADAIYRQIPQPHFRIILVQPDSNTMRVCDFVTASHSEDLLRLIRNNRVIGPSSTNFPS
jgi:DNA-binding NarL/FixJ family response regulator